MDGAILQVRLNAAWALVGQKAGLDYAVFRPVSALDPLADANQVLAALPCSISNRGSYTEPSVYGHAEWYSYHDAGQTQVGDYLCGPMGTFFIAAQQSLITPLLVQCNRTVSVTRPAQPTGKGAVGYGGEAVAGDTLLLRAWPCSCLEGSKGEENRTELPLDVKNPWWRMLLPALDGVNLQASDVLTDEVGNRYFVNSAERTALGWRLKTVLRQA